MGIHKSFVSGIPLTDTAFFLRREATERPDGALTDPRLSSRLSTSALPDAQTRVGPAVRWRVLQRHPAPIVWLYPGSVAAVMASLSVFLTAEFIFL